MASFAIKRWDGEIHVVEAASVQDAGNIYGWPGNGTIEPYDPAQHAQHVTANFKSAAEQGEFLASDKYQAAQLGKVTKLDKAAQKAASPDDGDSADSKGSK